jgi:type IV pilus assembly protein PilA
VLFVIGVLGAIAIPQYEDYTVRAQVAEGLSLADGVKIAVAERYGRSSAWPPTLGPKDIGNSASGRFVSQVYVNRGTIFIEYGGQANMQLADHQLTLRPTVSAVGEVLWSCGFRAAKGLDPPSGPASPAATTVPIKFLPTACRE